jgi:hypothetical protein
MGHLQTLPLSVPRPLKKGKVTKCVLKFLNDPDIAKSVSPSGEGSESD